VDILNSGNFSISPGCIRKSPSIPLYERGRQSECPDLLRSYEFWILKRGSLSSETIYEKGDSIMKVLVTYFSQTGNTEKIAGAICEEASQANEAELKKLEDVGPGDVAGYDFIFIGSPLHARNLAEPVKEFLGGIQAGSGQKMAGFITHFAPAYPGQDMDAFAEPIKAACKDKGIEYKGCFDCQGALTEALHEMVKKRQNLTDEQWDGMVKQMTGRPNEEDQQKARDFAKEVLG
jgi:flavodoxin